MELMRDCRIYTIVCLGSCCHEENGHLESPRLWHGGARSGDCQERGPEVENS